VPSFPSRHFDDRAGIVSPASAGRLDARLRAYEAESGRQVYVSIFAELPSPSLEDFCVRTATAWRVGRKGLDDGVILFAFVRQRKLRIEVGYGLEDRIPDAIAKRILEEHVAPRLAAGDVDGGFEAGVAAILAAAEGRPLPSPAPPSPQASTPVAIPSAPPEPSSLGIVLDAIADIARREVAGLPVGVAFLIVAFPLLTSPILRLLPIRRRLRAGEPLPRAWLIESGILLWLILSNVRSGRGGSSYGGSSSSSGGGGRFGGGGASGSW
jgi:uncharacterized protein